MLIKGENGHSRRQRHDTFRIDGQWLSPELSLNSPGGSTVVRWVTRQFLNACKLLRIIFLCTAAEHSETAVSSAVLWETNSSAVA